MKQNCRTLQAKKGFTLVELVVVIAILGILSVLIVPKVSGYLDRSRQATALANAKTIETCVNLGYMSWQDNGTAKGDANIKKEIGGYVLENLSGTGIISYTNDINSPYHGNTMQVISSPLTVDKVQKFKQYYKNRGNRLTVYVHPKDYDGIAATVYEAPDEHYIVVSVYIPSADYPEVGTTVIKTDG